MKNINLLLRGLILTAFVFAASVTSSETVLVIVNKANLDNLDREDVRYIYSDLISRWKNGQIIHIYELALRSTYRERFYQYTIGISARDSVSRWTNRRVTNTLKNLAPKIRRESSVVAAVAHDSNAIGYVSESAVAGHQGIRVLMRIE